MNKKSKSANKPKKAKASKAAETAKTAQREKNTSQISKKVVDQQSGEKLPRVRKSLPSAGTVSQYERLTTTLKALLGERRLNSLVDNELDALAKLGGVSAEEVRGLAAAAHLAEETGLPEAALFALCKGGNGPEIQELATANRAELKKKLAAAAQQNVISREVVKSFDALLPALQRLQADRAPLLHIARRLKLRIPKSLANKLKEQGVDSLDEFRRVGGIADSPEFEGSAATAYQTLQAHARLSLLSPDLETNARLIKKGHSTITDIVQSPRPVFINEWAGRMGREGAANFYDNAKVMEARFSNLSVGLVTNKKLSPSSEKFEETIPERCDCKDCESALSPHAYLVDLMKYTLSNLLSQNKPISYGWLQDNFYQPFSELPATCAEIERKVRRIRIAIEVLRRIFRAGNYAPVGLQKANLILTQSNYNKNVYETILTYLGTSWSELRVIRQADAPAQAAFAEKMAITLQDSAASVNHVNQLYIDPQTLSEHVLEWTFGIPNTDRLNPLSDGIIGGSAIAQIKRWNLSGVRWGLHTDEEGWIWLAIKRQSRNNYRIELYNNKAQKPEQLIGYGSSSSPTGEINVIPATALPISGGISIKYQANAAAMHLSAVPRFTAWRLAWLRKLWWSQDHPDDDYSLGKLPIIDPDVIGPDDFRDPTGNDNAFSLWMQRTAWVEKRLQELRDSSLNRSPQVGGIDSPDFKKLLQKANSFRYEGNNWKLWQPLLDVNSLRQQVKTIDETSDRQQADQLAKQLLLDTHLTLDAARFLVTIYDADARWAASPQTEQQVSPEQWEGVYSILVQAQKECLGATWVQQEKSKKVVFGPESFWIAQREPKAGTWPPLASTLPFIDPDLISVLDMPDPVAAGQTISIWQQRRQQLLDALADLEAKSHNLRGLNDRFATTWSSINRLDSLLDSLYNDVNSGDTTREANAQSEIRSELKIDPDEFEQLMNLRHLLQAGTGRPADQDWQDANRILLKAYKYVSFYPNWKNEEKALAYWQMTVFRLAPWRGMAERRQRWQQALRVRSAAALIDPDLLNLYQHVLPRQANPVANVFTRRKQEIDGILDSLNRPKTKLAELDRLLMKFLGPWGNFKGNFAMLVQEWQEGKLSPARREQLSITVSEFSRIAEIRSAAARIAPGNPLLSDDDWPELCNILVQVWKRRQAAKWQAEEIVAGIALSPDFFTIPRPVVESFPPPPPPELLRWRANRRDLQDWQDRLQARIDQEQSVIDAVREAVDKAEEASLPGLRDAVVDAADIPNLSNREAKLNWLADVLQVDFKIGACDKTNRIAQAIETLQGILWSVRNGLLADRRPELALVNANSHFDSEWQWIGSFATWRAAMFVFLYPENLLLPSLRRSQTPALYEIIQDLRNKGKRLIKEDTLIAAKKYSTYFCDISTLKLQFGVSAPARNGKDKNIYWTYLIGQGEKSKQFYWSMIYDSATAGIAGQEQSFWQKLSFSKPVSKFWGGATYRPPDQHMFLYAFATYSEDGKSRIAFTRLDLEDDSDWEDLKPIDLGTVPSSTAIKDVKIVQTTEGKPPRVWINLADNSFFIVTVDDRGTTTESAQYGSQKASWMQLGDVIQLSSAAIPDDPDFALAVGDIDGDGYDELVSITAGTPGNNHIHVRKFNDDRKVWEVISQYPLGNCIPWKVVLGDFDGDKRAEIAVQAYLNTDDEGFLTFKLAGTQMKPLGTLIGNWNWGLSEGPDGLAAGNFLGDKDGCYQILYLDHTSDANNAYLASYKNGIWSVQIWLSPVGGIDPYYALRNSFGAADLNGDGRDEFFFSFQTIKLSPTTEPLPRYFVYGCDANSNWYVLTPNTPGSIDDESFVASGRFDSSLLLAHQLAIVKSKNEDPSRGNDFWVDSWKIDWSPGGTNELDCDAVAGTPGGEGPAVFSVAGDFNRDGYDEIAVCKENKQDFWVYRYEQGQWVALSPGILSLSEETVYGIAGKFSRNLGGEQIVLQTRSNKLQAMYFVGDEVFADNIIPANMPFPGPYSINYNLLPRHYMDENTGQDRELNLQVWADNSRSAYPTVTTWRRVDRTYFEEAYYFVPMLFAYRLHTAGKYEAALDWYRILYDYALPLGQRRVYYGLVNEATQPLSFLHQQNWLIDPLNPHAIAETRRDSYTRYTMLSIIKCLIDAGDSEFTLDTAESNARARTLYTTALELLETEGLEQKSDPCSAWRHALKVQIGDFFEYEVFPLPYQILISFFATFATVAPFANNKDYYEIVLNRLKDVFAKADKANPYETYLEIQTVFTQAQAEFASPRFANVLAETISRSKAVEDILISDAGLSNTRVLLTGARAIETTFAQRVEIDGQFATATGLEEPVAAPANISYVPIVSLAFCISPNPVLEALRLRAMLNLYKLRTCRNIAGLEREVEPFAASTDQRTGLPTIGSGGQLVLPGIQRPMPTPYRFSFLIERAKSLAQIAGQVEAAYMSAMEKGEQAYADLQKARADLRLSNGSVQLQTIRLNEAQDGVTLSILQQGRAQMQFDYYDDLLNAGLSILESLSLSQLVLSALSSTAAAIVDYSLYQYGAGSSAVASAQSTTASIFSQLASYERRNQEWRFQHNLARQDILIGQQQVTLANDRVRVVDQERVIETMKADNANDVINFLTTRYFNQELFDWMAVVLEGVYSYFLQQATSTALLAANQLSFERQETVPTFIQADYWQPPADDAAAPGTKPADRRGLTGSARLLQDITQLEQFAIDTNQRKLQLSKTISIAQMDPFALQRFRETGVLRFATPLRMFDQDFPGHYLRLIHRMRTSVDALVPPTVGIRATLANTGISRVVTGGDIFQTVVVRRPPVTVALSKPVDATGLFDLEPVAAEFLLPFESMGVDTSWEFRMPKPANPIDYNTIADIRITIDYTALEDYIYRQQVIQSLPSSASYDLPFSFRTQLADAWYDLHNPDQTLTPMAVTFKTSRADFPANLDNIKIEHVLLYFVSGGDQPISINGVELTFTETNTLNPIGGAASTNPEGIISTRRGNAGPWSGVIGKKPVGIWTLKLPNSPEVRDLFSNSEDNNAGRSVTDILFVITYRGRLLDWPK